MREKMCEKVEAALEVVKQSKKSLTKGEIVMVFQQVVYDLNKQGERMKGLEQSVGEVKAELSNVKLDVQKILSVVEELKRTRNEHGLLYKILLGENAKYFYITVMVFLVVLAALFGVPASEFKGLLPTIGG